MSSDDDVIQPPPRFTPLLLDRIGVDELRTYIEELQAEIARVEAEIARKQSHRAGAESLFNFKT